MSYEDKKFKLNRRSFIQNSLIGATSFMTPAGTFLMGTPSVLANSQGPAKRVLYLVLSGGWDSAFASDPIIGSKQTSSSYEDVYKQTTGQYAPFQIPGKNTWLGAGFLPAKDILSRISIGVVNGMHMEVTAHELAYQYILSGRLSLSNSRDFPSVLSLMGQSKGTFPPLLVLGQAVPLGETRFTAPPIQVANAELLKDMLSKPAIDGVPENILNEALSLISDLDAEAQKRLTQQEKLDLSSWINSSQKLKSVEDSGIGPKLAFTQEVKDRFQLGTNGDLNSISGLLAGAYIAFSAGLTSYVSVSGSGFDTHQNQLSMQLPLQQSFSSALSLLLKAFQDTPDPDYSGRTLMDTTMIVITSEFVRTPKFNLNLGTDHWQSASVILLGAGVKDGAIIGATGDDAIPLGWSDSKAVIKTEDNVLLPDHFAATLLSKLGFNDEANTISSTRIDNLFT